MVVNEFCSIASRRKIFSFRGTRQPIAPSSVARAEGQRRVDSSSASRRLTHEQRLLILEVLLGGQLIDIDAHSDRRRDRVANVELRFTQQPLASLRFFLRWRMSVDVHVSIGVRGDELHMRLIDEEVRGEDVKLPGVTADVGEHAHVFLVAQQSDALVNVADENVVLHRDHAMAVDLYVDEGDALEAVALILPYVDFLTDGGDKVTENGIDRGDWTFLLAIVNDLDGRHIQNAIERMDVRTFSLCLVNG